MKFDKLNDALPFVIGGKPKVLRYSPYNAITLRFPGRHAAETTPKGGDFVVCVDDEQMDWTEHQFSHDDIFNQVQAYRDKDCFLATMILDDYFDIVGTGSDPQLMATKYDTVESLVHPATFLYAVQCLAVAEHRRYAKYEEKWGGRYLPFRFAAGIVEGHWTATDAMAWQRKGRPGVEKLEKGELGMPVLSAELMGLDLLTDASEHGRVGQ